jgi:hypothetical protein
MVRMSRDMPPGKQEHPTQQAVDVEISVCSFQLASRREVCPSQGLDQILCQKPWLRCASSIARGSRGG